jgi:uncharacterized protein involved in exopolysaccharide biosynthesis
MIPEVQHPPAVDQLPDRRRRSSDGASFRPRDEPDEVDLHRYLWALARRWPVLVGGAALGALLAVLALSLTPRLFDATATLVMTAEGIDPPTVAVVRALLTVQPAEQVVRELALDRPPHSLTPDAFLDRVTMENVAGTRFLQVTVRLQEPEAAAKGATALANKMVDRTRSLSSDAFTLKLEYLTRQVEQLRARLNAADQRIVEFHRAAPIDLASRRASSAAGLGTGSSRAPDSMGRDQEDQRASSEKRPAGRRSARNYELESELERLEVDRDVARRVYTDVAARYEEATAQLQASPPALSLMEPAVPPSQPIPRGTARRLLLGLITGFALPAAVIVVREARRRGARESAGGR